jgi:hypothetical protein
MNTELFPVSHERLLDVAEVFCDECGWYGRDDETRQSPTDFSRCPLCENVCTLNESRRGTHLEDDTVEDILRELMEQTLIFNTKYGYNCYQAEPRRFNACFEIDLHGQLQFNVLSWKEFHADNSKMDNYYIIRCQNLEVYSPKHVDMEALRDVLVAFEELINKLDVPAEAPFKVTQEYMDWCSEECLEGDDPDTHAKYLEFIGETS